MRIISISLYNSSPHCAPYLNRPILRLQLANHLIILPHGFADFVHLVSHHVRHVLLHRKRVHFVLSANATLIHERLTPCIGLDHLIESGALSVRANAHDRIAVLFRLPGDFPPLRADDKCETDEEDGNGEGEGGGEMVEQQLAHRRRVVDLLYARLPREPQHGEDDGSLHADAEAALRALEGVVAQTLPGIEDELRETEFVVLQIEGVCEDGRVVDGEGLQVALRRQREGELDRLQQMAHGDVRLQCDETHVDGRRRQQRRQRHHATQSELARALATGEDDELAGEVWRGERLHAEEERLRRRQEHGVGNGERGVGLVVGAVEHNGRHCLAGERDGGRARHVLEIVIGGAIDEGVGAGAVEAAHSALGTVESSLAEKRFVVPRKRVDTGTIGTGDHSEAAGERETAGRFAEAVGAERSEETRRVDVLKGVADAVGKEELGERMLVRALL